MKEKHFQVFDYCIIQAIFFSGHALCYSFLLQHILVLLHLILPALVNGAAMIAGCLLF